MSTRPSRFSVSASYFEICNTTVYGSNTRWMAEHSSCQFATVNVMFCRDQQPQCPCFRLDIGGSKLPDRWLNKDRQQDNVAASGGCAARDVACLTHVTKATLQNAVHWRNILLLIWNRIRQRFYVLSFVSHHWRQWKEVACLSRKITAMESQRHFHDVLKVMPIFNNLHSADQANGPNYQECNYRDDLV